MTSPRLFPMFLSSFAVVAVISAILLMTYWVVFLATIELRELQVVAITGAVVANQVAEDHYLITYANGDQEIVICVGLLPFQCN